jgi:hypothetical protein
MSNMDGRSDRLSPAQERVLLAMHPTEARDAWRLAWKLRTLNALSGNQLIEQGSRGWVDARLTDLGRHVRETISHAA